MRSVHEPPPMETSRSGAGAPRRRPRRRRPRAARADAPCRTRRRASRRARGAPCRSRRSCGSACCCRRGTRAARRWSRLRPRAPGPPGGRCGHARSGVSPIIVWYMDGSAKKPGKSPARSIVSTLPMVYKVLLTGSSADRTVAFAAQRRRCVLRCKSIRCEGGDHVEPRRPQPHHWPRRSARACARALRRPLPHRPLGRRARRPAVRDLRRRAAVDLPRTARAAWSRSPPACSGHGVRQGEHVLCWQPNTPEMLLTYYALNYLGAVYVPDQHGLSRRRARARHREFGREARRRARRPRAAPQGSARSRSSSAWWSPAPTNCRPRRCPPCCSRRCRAREADLQPLARPIEPWDTQSIIYTSGTTGPVEGRAVVVPAHVHEPGSRGLALHRRHRPLPGQHADVPHRRHGPAASRCSRAAARSCCPSASRPTRSGRSCARRETTAVFLLGVMATFLLKAPAGPQDRDHKVRKCFIVPLERRRGRVPPALRPRRLHDLQHDRDLLADRVRAEPDRCAAPAARCAPASTCGSSTTTTARWPSAQVGEMIVRTDRPWAMNSGYYKNAGGDRAGVAQRLVPHRRRVPHGRGRQLLLRRPHQGRDPPPRREHLVVRGRGRDRRASRPCARPRRSPCRANSARTR